MFNYNAWVVYCATSNNIILINPFCTYINLGTQWLINSYFVCPITELDCEA